VIVSARRSLRSSSAVLNSRSGKNRPLTGSSAIREFAGQPEWEVSGDAGFAHALFFQQADEHRRKGRFLPGALRHRAIRNHLVHLRLRAAPVDLQVVEHHQTAPRFFQINKSVGRGKTGGMEQVRIGLARGDDKAGQVCFRIHNCNGLFRLPPQFRWGVAEDFSERAGEIVAVVEPRREGGFGAIGFAGT